MFSHIKTRLHPVFIQYWHRVFVAVIAALFAFCALPTPLSGTSSGVETKIAQGVIVQENGSAAANAKVWLIPSGYNPVVDSLATSLLCDTTDSLGHYAFRNVDTGSYTVYVIKSGTGAKSIRYALSVLGDSILIASDTLKQFGTIKVYLPANADALNGYIYVPGTFIHSDLNGNAGAVFLDSVPTNMVPLICYAVKSSSFSTIVRYNVAVVIGDTAIVYNPLWHYARQLELNTTSTGAAVTGSVYNFPVLIRLTSNNYDFSQALPGGRDVRFTKEDNIFLSYDIERWDSANAHAEVWVKVDTLFGNNASQNITMYWGNAAASDSSNSANVFDTTTGFQGVWHMGQQGNATALDATANHYNGTPFGMSTASAVEGIIGMAQQFDGVSCYFTMQNTASSTLSFPENGPYTLSAWVYANALDSLPHYIISKGNRNYNLDFAGWYNYWETYNYLSSKIWISAISKATDTATWHYITGVRNGADLKLYVDGICTDSTLDSTANSFGRDTLSNLQIGKRSENTSYGFWNGMIDEPCVANVSRSADWIKLCYMNQNKNDMLVRFK